MFLQTRRIEQKPVLCYLRVYPSVAKKLGIEVNPVRNTSSRTSNKHGSTPPIPDVKEGFVRVTVPQPSTPGAFTSESPIYELCYSNGEGVFLFRRAYRFRSCRFDQALLAFGGEGYVREFRSLLLEPYANEYV